MALEDNGAIQVEEADPNKPSPPITALVADSRQAAPGACFVAVPGTQVDGAEFAAEAAEEAPLARAA